MTDISKLGEFGLIHRLTDDIKIKNESTVKGVGDDCAVMHYPDKEVLVTTDMLMEGVHFDLTYIDQQHLGYKSAMVNISDIIAMGGTPRQMTVSLALSKRFTVEDTEQFYTLQTSGAGSGVRQTFSDEEKDKFARAYTAQLLVSPASQIDMTDGNAVIFSLGDRHRLSLGTKTGNSYPLYLETGSTSANTGLWLKESCFTSVTLSCDSLSGFRVTLIDDNDSIRTYTNAAGNLAASVDAVCFGGTASENDQKSCFAGYIDEMRLFSGKALTEEEIKENYNHPLSGVEDGLFIYWPVDEGIEDQLTAYDYSKTNGVANAHHGNIKLCKVSGTLPPANMLSLFAVTDSQGNYTLRGVPFNGSGTTYTITPQC